MLPWTDWRVWLSAGGLLSAVVPAVHGDWLAAGIAGVGGLAIVGAWCWATTYGKRIGLPIGVALLVLLLACVVVSRWPTGAIVPPWQDWLMVWLPIAAVMIVALIFDLSAHRQGGKIRVGQSAPILPYRLWIASLTVMIVPGLCCVLAIFASVMDESDRTWRFEPRTSEILPLPVTLRLISADSCASGGSSGNCTARFDVAGVDGADRATTASRLVDHLRRSGWPLELVGDNNYRHFYGCRKVSGILPWTDHCLWLYLVDDPLPKAGDPRIVTIYIDNV